MDNDPQYSEWHDMIEEIREEHPFESSLEIKALGISAQVINDGYASLAPTQKSVFDAVFRPLVWKKQDAKDRARRIQMLGEDEPPRSI